MFLWESNRKIERRILSGALVRPGNRSRDAFGTVEFGFDVGDIAFGEVVEELPGAVFLFDLRQNGLGEARAALTFFSCCADPVAQIGKIAAEGGYVCRCAGFAVARDEGEWRFGGKFGKRGERFEPGKSGSVD